MFDDSVQKAKDLLSLGDVRSYIYACLELRFAIEKHVYKKINFYSKRLGKKQLFSAWQPNKALKILCQLQPYADQSYELRFSPESEPGKPTGDWKSLGKHEALSAKWVSKHYHKLSSFLHRSTSGDLPDSAEIVSYLHEIISEIERIESSSLMSDLHVPISTDCKVCGEKIVCSDLSISTLEEVVCPNMSCNATYKPTQDENGNWGFIIKSITFKCPDCDQEKDILENELKIGATWKCKKCRTRYHIWSNTWNIDKIKNS